MYEVHMIYNETGDIKEMVIAKVGLMLRLVPRMDYAPTGEYQRADQIVQALIAYDKIQETK